MTDKRKVKDVKYSTRKYRNSEDRTLAELRGCLKATLLKNQFPVKFKTIEDAVDFELDKLVDVWRQELIEDMVYEDTRKKERFT